MPPASSWIKNLLLLVASVALALALGEGALRLVGFSAPIWYRPDAKVGWSLRPGLQARFTSEGNAYVRINAEGQRDDRDHAFAKPPGVYRIAVLGDSYSEAMQVDVHDAWWRVLARDLERCGFAKGKRIEVINFGVSGFGTAQEYLVLKTEAARYHPDLVLLQFTDGNDVMNNSPALEPEKMRPFLVADGRGGFRFDESFLRSAAYASRTSEIKRLARHLSNRVRLLQLVRVVKERGLLASASAALPDGAEAGEKVEVLAPPRDAVWREAWRVTEELIRRTAAEAKAIGAQFAVVMTPYEVQVNPDRRLRAALAVRLEVPDLLYPERRLSAFGRAHGIEIIPLAPAMLRIAERDHVFFHGFANTRMGYGHWNVRGHREAARLIAERLCGR